jgi:hypothetical protein
MYIKKDKIEKITKKTIDKCLELRVQFSREDLHFYQGILRSLKDQNQSLKDKNKYYKEGEEISARDQRTIDEEVAKLLRAVQVRTVSTQKKAPGSLEIKDAAEYMMTAMDYLYALTMKNLGSPDMDPFIGPKSKSALEQAAVSIYSAYQNKDSSRFDHIIDQTYQNQRGKNASDLKNNFGIEDRIAQAKKSTAHPDEIAQLLADYRALQTRQKNHGPVWRLFHLKENEARNQLLGQMKDALDIALQAELNPKVQLDPKNPELAIKPAAAAEIYGEKNFRLHLEKCTLLRNQESYIEETYASDELQNEPNQTIEVNHSRQHLSKEEQHHLVAEINEKNPKAVQAPVQEPQLNSDFLLLQN